MDLLTRAHRSFFFSGALILLCLYSPFLLYGQTFSKGLSYYQNENYQKAAAIFKNMDSERARLFLGKSFYALGNYQKALEALGDISTNNHPQLYKEAVYTSALVNYQQKQFGKALSKLYKVSQTSEVIPGRLSERAKKLYHQILNYLTARQREKIIKGDYNDTIKFDLLKSALGKIPFRKAADLYRTFTQNAETGRWNNQLEKIHSNLGSKSDYRSKYGSPEGKLQPPKGTIYHIGVLMPRYKPSSGNYSVVKALYLGSVLAADQYNQEHQNTKVYIHFVDSGGSSNGMKTAIQNFSSQEYGDILIGPLFSRELQPIVSITSKYHIPAIAPLANKDINLKNSWVYQANPTYKVFGKAMAKFAVNTLGINRFTIISDKNSRGAVAARAFHDKAIELGANINHYFIRNLGSSYEFSKYTRYLGNSTPPVNTVYAPLNGSNALTLIDLLLRKARSVSHHITVLGAQEWEKYHQYKKNNSGNIDIYYTKSTQSGNNRQLNRFKNEYRNKFKSTGNEYAVIGYDVTRFVLKILQNIGNPGLLQSAIAHQPRYKGLARNIYFNGTHVNHAVDIVHVSD